MVVGWFTLFVILLFIELVTVNLVTIWFAIGAVAAIITTIFTDSVLIQTIVFVVVSGISLLITKPLINKLKGFEVTPTNSDRVIGKLADVTKDIIPNNFGEVKIFGEYWTAISEEKIKAGAKVRVKAIEGVKLIVEKEEE